MYRDFEKTNDVWTWVKEGDSYTFKNVSLDNMIAGDSVTGDTEIRVRDTGTVQIESLFTSKDHIEGEKEYCFPEDLYVLSYDWRTKSTCYKKVKYVMRHHIDSSFKKVYKCSINNMTSVNVTEDHSLMGFKSNTNHKQKDIDEVIRGEASPLFEMKPLEANSSLVTLSEIPKQSGDIPSGMKELSTEMFQFLGFFIGDGSVTSKSAKYRNSGDLGVGMSIGLDMEEGMHKIIHPLLDTGEITHVIPKSNGYDIRCGMKDKETIRHFINDDGKTIPDWLCFLEDDKIEAFLRGYFSADGGVIMRNNNPIVRLTSVSEHLLRSVRELLLTLGIGNSIYRGNTRNTYNGKSSNTQSKYLIIKEIEKFRDRVGFVFDRKQSKLQNYKSQKFYKRASDFGLTCSPMKSVEEVEGFSGYVYDIEVEDTHVFFANDILVHNTDSGIFSLIDESVVLDDVIDVADTIASITNDSFPDFVKHAFNCPEDRKHTIQTDREVVSDKSLFLSKKRYIMHIVNDEGKEVDKLKIQGVEIKKSDTPKAVQDYLLKVTKMILDGYSEEEVKEEVAKMKEDFKKRPIQEIARPMSVKKLKQYYDMVDMTGSKKGIHWNGLAAMFYNSLCSTRDKKITPQDKVGILSIRHKDSKYIGFPMDLDELPDFMYDLTYDYPVMWDKSYKKINNYLESLGWDARSKKESKKEELFGF